MHVFERLRHASVQFPTAALELGLVCDLAREGVLELVLALRIERALEQELGLNE